MLVARSTYALPYKWSAMTVERDGSIIRYRSRRRWPGPTPATSAITVDVGDPLAPEELGEFDHYLTARWQLYTTLGPVLARSTYHVSEITCSLIERSPHLVATSSSSRPRDSPRRAAARASRVVKPSANKASLASCCRLASGATRRWVTQPPAKV